MSLRTHVDRFFAGMQGGPTEEPAMAALFADDAVYVEPFSGLANKSFAPTTHTGLAAVRAALRASLAQPLPEQRIVIDRVEVDGDVLTAWWTCFSPALPGGQGRGKNIFTFHVGRIARLETSFLP